MTSTDGSDYRRSDMSTDAMKALMKTQNIVLLTATIRTPSDVKNLQRTGVAVRLNDYIDALGFYISKLNSGVIDKIVFCDNSGYDLAALYDIAGDLVSHGKVEFPGSMAWTTLPPSAGATASSSWWTMP